MLAVTPPHTLIQHASASTVVSATKISHSYPYDCNEGSYDASQSPYDGTWYVRDKKLCKHESLAPHLYDDKGYCNYILHDITAVDTKLIMDILELIMDILNHVFMNSMLKILQQI